MFNKKSKSIIIIILFFTIIQLVRAGDIGNSTGYIWMEKLGWISMGGSGASVDYGVTVGDAALSGYAWSEKTGWINFNDAGSYYAVTNDGSGNLSGYAWSEKLGYISFDDASANNYYQVVLTAGDSYTVEEIITPGKIILRNNTSLRSGVSLRPGVTGEIDVYISVFSNYAWSEKGGYINMDDAGSLYSPDTEWAE